MYGENTGRIRDELAALLRQHRIQQRLGGAGSHTIPVVTDEQDRAAMGALIQRYRHGILTWCRQAVEAAEHQPRLPRDPRNATHDIELHRRLVRTIDAATAGLPSLDDLTTASPFALVEHWRHAARAAAIGEHDLPNASAAGSLDLHQSRTVVHHAAEITRALIVLDQRYKNIPGWEHLRRARSLEKAAEACAFQDNHGATVDDHGWRPTVRPVDGPTMAGIAGVLQAQHNVLAHLHELPTVLNLRRIANTQRQVATLAARTLTDEDPDLTATWHHRADVYAELGRRLRNIDGLAGDGGAAAAESANAVTRLRALREPTPTDRDLRRLDRLFSALDRRIVDTVRTGATERIYFARARLPRIDTDDGRPAHQPRERFRPITRTEQIEITACMSGRSASVIRTACAMDETSLREPPLSM